MVKDNLHNRRRKSKMVFEVRYTAIPEAFDRRGVTIRKLNNQFKNKLPSWKGQNLEVTIRDDSEIPLKEISINQFRSHVIYEDPASIAEFDTDVRHFLDIFYNIYKDVLDSVSRVGVRFVSIFALDELGSFEAVRDRIIQRCYGGKLPVDLPVTDIATIVNHDAGMYRIGPVKRSEPWIDEMFITKSEFLPNYGVGIDVDSYARSNKVGSSSDLKRIFAAVRELTTSTEYELLNSIL